MGHAAILRDARKSALLVLKSSGKLGSFRKE
jgi:hypothetical protein